MMMLAQRIAVNECDVYQRRVVCVQTAEQSVDLFVCYRSLQLSCRGGATGGYTRVCDDLDGDLVDFVSLARATA